MSDLHIEQFTENQDQRNHERQMNRIWARAGVASIGIICALIAWNMWLPARVDPSAVPFCDANQRTRVFAQWQNCDHQHPFRATLKCRQEAEELVGCRWSQ